MVDGGGDQEHQHDQVIDGDDECDEDDDGDDTGSQRTSEWSWTGSVYTLGGDGWMIYIYIFF